MSGQAVSDFQQAKQHAADGRWALAIAAAQKALPTEPDAARRRELNKLISASKRELAQRPGLALGLVVVKRPGSSSRCGLLGPWQWFLQASSSSPHRLDVLDNKQPTRVRRRQWMGTVDLDVAVGPYDQNSCAAQIARHVK